MKKHHIPGLPHRILFAMLLVYAVILAETVRNPDAAAFPAFSVSAFLDGSWHASLEEYLEQHLGFHDTLFRVKSQTDLLLGEKMIEDVYVTKRGLMEKLDLSGTEPDASWINAQCEDITVPVYFILVPTAAAIYESDLPANAPSSNQERFIRSVYAKTESRIRCVDTYHILRSLKEDYIYYRTDSHWTSYGAYYVYQSAIQKMGFTPIPYQRYVISHLCVGFRGDLYRKTLYQGSKPDILDCYHYESGVQVVSITAYFADGSTQERSSLYDMAFLQPDPLAETQADAAEESSYAYQFYSGQSCEKLIIRTDLDNHKKLLLYKDDFADCMIPFLLQHYEEICVIDMTQDGAEIAAAEESTDYTQVLFLCSLKSWQSLTET